MSNSSISRFGKSGNPKPRGFKPWSSQTNDFKIDTCHFPASRLALLGSSKDWLAQCQDNVTEWDTRSWWPGFPVRQHYKIGMRALSHKSVPDGPSPGMIIYAART